MQTQEQSSFTIRQTLSEGQSTMVLRATRDSDDRSVILKALRGPHPSPAQIAQLHREFELTVRMGGAGVVKALGMTTHEDLPAIVLEDLGARSLDGIFRQTKAPLDTFLLLAIKIAEALGELHKRRIIHKDLGPSNIIWNANTGELKLIDLGIASTLSRETTEAVSANVLSGTLPYLAPEQTGRMNRVVDYRTDFYALGATFYQLLTGRPPFTSEDPLALIHAHIALPPTPPHALDPTIPLVLSEIVLQLLAKNAEDRYQSAAGLLADLEDCRAQLEQHGTIKPFVLGLNDFAERLQIPQALYGREQEVAALLDAFERVANGTLELALIRGYSGIGKTSLVREVQKPIVARRGHFLSGKFEQLRRDIPYAALSHALRDFLRQILADTEPVVARWRERLTQAIRPNAAVLVELLPELTLLLGPQPPVAELPTAEAEIRLHRTVQQLLGALAKPEHPLVLFLDDLQWADRPSIHLVEALATNPDATHLLIVGAYRDNEVDEGHPVSVAVREIKKTTPVHAIELGPLADQDVRALLADALHHSPEEIAPLAEICAKKTGGNPFFLRRFLQQLGEEGLVRFDQGERRWRWDLDELDARDITDNVVELMAAKIRRLEGEGQPHLPLAACIGSRFTLSTLALLSQTPPGPLLDELRDAQQEGLLVGDTTAGERAGDGNGEEIPFRFAHDRVQQAAYSLVPEDRRRQIHLTLGRHLSKERQEQEEERDEGLFTIVNHLDEGATLITDRAERDHLAELNLEVARKAKKSAAYTPALRYCDAGLDMLGPWEGPHSAWRRRYEPAYALHLLAAELAFLTGDYERMDALIEAISGASRSPLEAIAALEIRINAKNAQHDLVGAVETALAGLSLLGVQLPRDPGPEQIGAGLGTTMGALEDYELHALPELTATSDPKIRTIMRLLVAAMAPAYFANPTLLPLLAFELVRRSLQDGLAPESSYGFAVLAVVLGSADMLAPAYAIGKMAPRMGERFDNDLYANMAVHIFNTHARFWKEPYRASLAPLRQVHQVALELGDLKYAAFSIFMYCALSLYSGRPLSELDEEFHAASLAIERAKQKTSMLTHNIGRQTLLNLTGQAKHPTMLAGPVYDEEQMLPVHLEANDRTNIFVLYLNKTILAYLFRDLDLARQMAAKAAAYPDSSASTVYIPVFVFWSTLSMLATAEQREGQERDELVAHAREQRTKLERWADFGPANHSHMLHLVDAELARIEGDKIDAMMAYDRAIEVAHDHAFLGDEALAQELAGRFHLAEGHRSVARAYITEAAYTYRRWGADAKVQQLSDELGELMPRLVSVALTTTTMRSTDELDLETVMRAAQAISSEIVLDRLLDKIMRIAIENAGAQRGALVLQGDEGPRVEAEADVSGQTQQQQIAVGRSIPLGEYDGISPGIVSYVLRSGEPVVLSDAAREGAFVRDPYVQRQQPRSVLCAPIASRGTAGGALYLENNLAPGTFTQEHLRVLSLLSSQAMISIENTKLYNELEKKVAERTTQLERSNRFIRAIFGRYLSSEVVDELLDAPEGVGLGGEKRKVTIMMTDLRGFTSAASKLAPEKVVSVINNYLSAMTDVILKYHGTIDEFIGDAIMAIFGAPLFRPSDAERAVACAVEMQLAMDEVNADNRVRGLPEVEMGIGLHTAEVVVGNIGSQKRLKYGVVGSGVNLTGRIEGYTVGGQILISEDTYRDTSVPLRIKSELWVEAKGVDDDVHLYDVIGIGGKYDLHLPRQEEERVSLDPPIEVLIQPISGKYVGEDRYAGRFTRLSSKTAELRTTIELQALLDLKLRILDERGQALPDDVYAKVMSVETTEGGTRALLRFTSLPEEVAAHLSARRQPHEG